MKKTFRAGEVVVFQGETHSRWRLGEYVSTAGEDMPGRHCVRDDRGILCHVPLRRIKKPDYDKPIASSYDPHGTGR